jgi:SPP1 gp7 family putative phage head morphogenesis protein
LIPGQNNQDQDKSIENAVRQKRADIKWEKFIQVVTPQERLFSGVMSRFFESQHEEVKRNLNKYKASTPALTKDAFGYILFSMQDANNKLATISKENVRNAFVSGLNLGMSDTNSYIDFNLYEPNIVRAVQSRVEFFATTINRTTADLIKDQLTAGIQNGESIIDISRRIDSVYEYSKNHRAKTTAQTEVIGAVNEGQLKAYKESGMEGKEWITARDEKVRASHQIDGQRKKINDPFILASGTKLNCPGDRSLDAPVGDLINCRCNLLPIRKMGEE